MRIRHCGPVVGLLCLAAAGCTTASPGEATPAPTSEVSSTGSAPTSSGGGGLPSNGAPKVEDPLEDTSRFEKDPCSILTAAQTQDLKVPATGREEDGTVGLDCEWNNKDTRGWVAIGFLTNNDRGLSAFYAENRRKPYAYLTPLPDIEGYPAIASDSLDRRSQGVCLVQVGVTDQLAFHVDLHLSPANVGTTDACETAAQVAGMALQTMKEGA